MQTICPCLSMKPSHFLARFNRSPILGLILLALIVPRLAHAAAVSLTPGVTTIADGGTAPGNGSDYVFFGDGNPIALPDFTLSNVTAQYRGVSSNVPPYSTLQAPTGGADFTTGIAYNGNAGQINLATFTLQTGTNQNYAVFVLFGNSDGNAAFDQNISLSLNGGSAVTALVTDTQSTNNFLTFNVAGLNAGDTLTFSATPAAQDAFGHADPVPYIGAVSFAVAPEPSMWTALLGGVICMLGLASRRRVSHA